MGRRDKFINGVLKINMIMHMKMLLVILLLANMRRIYSLLEAGISLSKYGIYHIGEYSKLFRYIKIKYSLYYLLKIIQKILKIKI